MAHHQAALLFFICEPNMAHLRSVTITCQNIAKILSSPGWNKYKNCMKTAANIWKWNFDQKFWSDVVQPAFNVKTLVFLLSTFYRNDNSRSSCRLCLKIHQWVKSLTPPFSSNKNKRERVTIPESERERKLLLQLLLTITYLSHRESFQYPTTKRWVFPLNVGHSIWDRESGSELGVCL